MNRILSAGIALSLAGLVAYAAGILTAYPGRSFSVTALMVGVTLLAIGRSGVAEPDGETA